MHWAAPNDEVFEHHVNRIADVTTEILGRRAYQLMEPWMTPSKNERQSAAEQQYAQYWQTVEKLVVSATFSASRFSTDEAQLVRELPLSDIRRIVAKSHGVVEIFGPTTATEAIRACLVDRFEFYVVPVVLGRGRRALPEGAFRKMRLEQSHIFANGTVYLRYGR